MSTNNTTRHTLRNLLEHALAALSVITFGALLGSLAWLLDWSGTVWSAGW